MKKLFTIIAIFICVSSFEQTVYGVLNAQMPTVQAGENQLNQSGLNLARLTVFWGNTYYSKTVDLYLNDGYEVAINFDYLPTVTPQPYATDTNKLKSQANLFFQHYTSYKSKIPFVTFENEWDNPKYHYGKVQDYVTRLKIFVSIAHSYGFEVEDAAITCTGLCEWTYYQLSADSAALWAKYFYVGGKGGSQFANKIDTFINGVKNIPSDYLNFHWYSKNALWLQGALNTALYHYKLATGKNITNTNEFGAYTTAEWNNAVDDIHSVPLPYAIAYSGINAPNNAITLTPIQLSMLSQ